MTIFLDTNFRCHLSDDGTRQAVETDVFNGKCPAFIEGYQFIPEGQEWTRPDGAVFRGLMVAPATNYALLEAAQAQHELDEVRRWGSLGIPLENSLEATSNHVEGEFLSVQGKLCKCVYPIPATCTIVPGTNIVPATMEEYLESIKEG